MVEYKNNRVIRAMWLLIDVFVENTPAKQGSICPKPADMVNDISAPDPAKKGGYYYKREQNEH